MPVNDELGKRMKEFYENVPKTKLMRRTPVAIRIDGRAFHTFTHGFQKPFDEVLMKTMQETTKYLCENIQGCVFGYTQSDEITLILVDYKELNTSAWFDYEIMKLCSISASMATMAFNKFFEKNLDEWTDLHVDERTNDDYIYELGCTYFKAVRKGAMFDARCFNIPKEEVTNLIYWRQLDATRNSVQMVGQANFSHKELQGMSCGMIKDILYMKKGIEWNDYPTDCKRGAAVIRKTIGTNASAALGIAGAEYKEMWVIDRNMPMLKGEDRKYLDDLIYVGE